MTLTFEKRHPHFVAEVSPIDLRTVHDAATWAKGLRPLGLPGQRLERPGKAVALLDPPCVSPRIRTPGGASDGWEDPPMVRGRALGRLAVLVFVAAAGTAGCVAVPVGPPVIVGPPVVVAPAPAYRYYPHYGYRYYPHDGYRGYHRPWR
jgi:hypothetical protein